MGGNLPGLARQIAKDHLSDIPGDVGIAADPSGGGPDQIAVPPDQFRERFLHALVSVAAQEFGIRKR